MMISKALTEKDLELDEKKVFGAIITLWCLGDPQDPYAHSKESKVIKDAEKAGLSREKIQEILDALESKNLIRRTEEGGHKRIMYRAESEHIVKELQKTTYVDSRFEFKPPHH
jgi:predicted transcriptional regulator